jgi:hypothetical protein
MSIQRESDSLRADRSTPVIFKENVRGLVAVDDLKVPSSELAMHVGAAGKDILAWVMSCSGVMIVYEKDGCCGITHGLHNELLSPELIKTTKQMWMQGKCQE